MSYTENYGEKKGTKYLELRVIGIFMITGILALGQYFCSHKKEEIDYSKKYLSTERAEEIKAEKEVREIRVDFREAILYHDIRISLNGEDIHENQTLLLSTQPTWVVGIYYDGKWQKEVILRDGNYNKVRNTPYQVKLDGSIGLIIPYN